MSKEMGIQILRVGRSATLGGGYPGIPEWFVQVWDDDVLFASVYGDTIEEARDRAAVIVEKFNSLSDRISSVLAKTEQNLAELRSAELGRGDGV